MFAVRLHSEKMPQTPGGPIRGPITYKSWADTSAKGRTNPKISSATLLPGWNFKVSADDLKIIRESAQGQKHLARGIIEVINPASPSGEGEGEGFSPDFADDVALTLIEQAEDLAWLNESLGAEQRPAIKTAIKTRIAELEEELSIMADGNRPTYA